MASLGVVCFAPPTDLRNQRKKLSKSGYCLSGPRRAASYEMLTRVTMPPPSCMMKNNNRKFDQNTVSVPTKGTASVTTRHTR